VVALACGWRLSGNKLAPCFAKENLREVNVLLHLRQELKERASYCREEVMLGLACTMISAITQFITPIIKRSDVSNAYSTL